jgi:hypothetical protein
VRYLRILKDWNIGTSSDPTKHRLLAGNIYNCTNDEKADDLIKRGIAVEVKFGWIPQPEDKRDYTFNFAKLPGVKAILPVSCDLRTTGFMPVVIDQGPHGTCTSAAKTGLNGYMEAKQGHAAAPFSINFSYYKTVHDIEGGNPLNDPGATVRGTLQAGQRFGNCFSNTWPYDDSHFGKAPNAAAISEALNYQDLFYALLDPTNTPVATILSNAKNMLAAGYPFEFGFRVLSSFMNTKADGLVAFPKSGEQLMGGHAVLAVGYNDTIRCPNTNSTGAFLCRNSWGPSWGMSGYFWLPYEFVTRSYNGSRLMSDMWALGKVEWMNV